MVPNGEVDVLVLYGLDVKANRGNSGHNFAKLNIESKEKGRRAGGRNGNTNPKRTLSL